jgi:phosphatidylserine/phosphatidylglycerophosphate/cardiolipin synthase-like enzyme
MFDPFHRLTTATLRDVAALCRQAHGPSPPATHVLQQLAGSELGDELARCLRNLADQGWQLGQIAATADTIIQTRERTRSPDQIIDLVLSGPDAPGIATRDTAAVMHSLMMEARREVLLVGYALYDAQDLFEPLARRLASEPDLRVWCCFDIGRKPKDTSLPSEIVARFAHEFVTEHWPWEPRPEVYYDPRSLEPPGPHRSSLHAKCVVVDRRAALVTSANFTQAAQRRNIECGIAVRHPQFAEHLARYFETLCQTHQMLRCVLPTPARSG